MGERAPRDAVTRADVAAAAGVSPAVVSYVLNDGPRPVAAATRARVEAAIAQLGYRPNAVASALRRGQSRMVGLLTSSPTNPFFAELSTAFVDAALARNQAMAIGIGDQPYSRGRTFLRSLADHRIDGIIIAADGVSVPQWGELRSMSAVAMSADVADALNMPVPIVTFDNDNAGEQAVEHLASHSHTVIGCIAGPWNLHTADERVAGWRRACGRLGLPTGAELIERGEFSAMGGYAATLKLLGPDPRHHDSELLPTALFVSSDIHAFGVLQACAELGLRVPEDIAIVSIDGTVMAGLANPPLTSVRQPLPVLAEAALAALASLRDGEQLTGIIARPRGNLVIARSCGCGIPARSV